MVSGGARIAVDALPALQRYVFAAGLTQACVLCAEVLVIAGLLVHLSVAVVIRAVTDLRYGLSSITA